MLLALLVTALSASSALSTDSVRSAARVGSAQPDTTKPTPAVAVPRQPVPEAALPVPDATAIAQPSASPAVQASIVQPSPGRDTTEPPVVVQQAATTVAANATMIADGVAKDVAAKIPTGAPEVAAIKPPTMAPADAVATVAAAPGNVTTTRIDPRTVVSVKSSESIEPLYAVPIPAAGVRIPRPIAADSIVVYKRERTMILYNRGVPVKSYFVALGSKPVGDKERVGDQKTPEGLFRITAHNPASKYHLGLRLSYPLESHRARAAALGVDPGGDIMIHGLPKDFSEAGKAQSQNDWTNGCVAVSNQEIEEIWHAVPDGTPVQIKP